MNWETKHFYAFGPFRLDAEKRVLVRGGVPVPLAPKAADTLLLLVKNAGHLVEKDELMAQVWPDAQEFGYRDEAEAFLLQYGHGVGLSLWERPIISKRYTGQNTPLKEGMVFALETWKGAEDGSGAARIEEEVVVTKDGCQIITNFPSDRLISCGLPGCEVF